MATKFDTKDWELFVGVKWVLKPHACRKVVCDRCGGDGKIGGGFANPDPIETCPSCSGRGERYDSYVPEEMPERLPIGLVEELRRVLTQFQPSTSVVNGDWHPV